MSQMLPTHNFRWLTSEEIRNLLITQLDEDSEDGYIFEVNCFPFTLHCLPFTYYLFDKFLHFLYLRLTWCIHRIFIDDTTPILSLRKD